MDEAINLANNFFQNQNYDKAIQIYDNLIKQDDQNYILYCNRSSALFKKSEFKKSLEDAIKAINLNSKSIKAHYREGMALRSLDRPIDAIIAFSKGLVIDSYNTQLLNSLLNTLKNTRFWSSIESSLTQLELIESTLKPFLVISLIGQHILTLGHFLESSILLDCCLKMDIDSLKLKSSVYAAIAVAYWKLANKQDKSDKLHDKYGLAINAMKNDLNCVIKLKDYNGQYRALKNLGLAFYQLGQFNDALDNYRAQLDIAEILDNRLKIIETLKLIGNVQHQLKLYKDSIKSYEKILNLAKQEEDLNSTLKALKSLSTLHSQLNNFQNAISYQERLCDLVEKVSIFYKLKSKAYLELSDLFEFSGNHEKAIELIQQRLLKIDDKNLVPLIYEKLAINEFKLSNYLNAKKWFEKQLILTDNLERFNCLVNLANVNFKLKNYQLSIDLNEKLLEELDERGNQTIDHNDEKRIKILNNLAECHFILNNFNKSINYFKAQLKLDHQANQVDQSNEFYLVRLNALKKLSICYKKTKQLDDTLKVYFEIFNYSKENNDLEGQLWSFYNIGIIYYINGAFEQSISIFQEYLTLLDGNDDQKSFEKQKIKIIHYLALIYFKLNDFNKSFNYFRQDLNLMERLKEHLIDLQNTNIDLDNLINSPIEQKYGLSVNELESSNLNDVLNCSKICCLLISPKSNTNQCVDDILNSLNELNL